MPLDTDDITNLERGIDAAVEAIIEMAQQSSLHIAQAKGRDAAGPIIGFIQALQENRGALANKCLIDAIARHPDAGDSNTTVEREGMIQ